MNIISKADARKPGALCEVIAELPSRYDVKVLLTGPKGRPLSVEGGILAGTTPWVTKKNVEKVDATETDYALYLMSH